MLRILAGAGSYPVAILFSTTLHILLVVLLTGNWFEKEEPRRIIQPKVIQAKLLQIEAQPKVAEKPIPVKPKPKPKIDPAIEKKKKLAQEKKRKAEQEKKRQQRLKREKELADKKKREQLEKEKQRQLELERQKAEALRQQQLEEARRAEQQRLAELNEQELVGTYSAYIADRIAANWNRPPNSRRNMQVTLALRLTPNGQVVGVNVVKGSGSEAFDRSAEQAVLKVERFDRLRELDPAVFERNFRTLELVFRPDDLRQ